MNIDKVRLLLASYYDGTATGAEVNALMRYFVEANDVPDDLRIDAAIFRAMASTPAVVVPPDLEQKIMESTIGSRPRRRFLNWRVTTSVAASLALVISLGMAFMHNKPAEEPVESTLLVSSVISKEEVVVNTEPVEQQTVPVRQAQPVQAKVARSKPASGAYREITDSAQVVEITTRLLARLDASFNKVEYGVKKTEIAVAIIANPFDANKLSDQLSK